MSELLTNPKLQLKHELVLNLLTRTNKTVDDIAAMAKTSKRTIYKCADQHLGPGFMQKRKEMIAVNKITEAAGKGPVLAFDNNDDLVKIVESPKQKALPCQTAALPCPSAMKESCEELKAEEDGRDVCRAPVSRQAKPCDDDGRITIECEGIKISWTEPAADKRAGVILQVIRELRG